MVDELRRRFAPLLSEEHEKKRRERLMELHGRHEKPSTSQETKLFTPVKTTGVSLTVPTLSTIGGMWIELNQSQLLVHRIRQD